LSATIDLTIDHLDAWGDGVAVARGLVLSIPYTIPGERVRVVPDRRRGAPVSATLVEILQPSPHRVVPRCPHFGPCGGCAWQHIAYPEQLRLKSALVTRLVGDALRRAPAAGETIAATPLDAPWGYRQKVHFTFATVGSRGRRTLIMGHYARGSRRVIPVSECPVHDGRGNDAAFAFQAEYRRSSASQGDTLKSLAVRCGLDNGETMATLVVTADADKGIRAATRRVLSGRHAPTSFHLNIHPKDDGFIFGRETRRIHGPERLREQVGGASFLLSPTAFFQTNVAAAEILVGLVRAAMPAGVDVLDLYAGAGLFALPLALAGHRVMAVEGNRSAVADGEASARLNKVPAAQCRFVAAPVETAVRGLASRWGGAATPVRRSLGESVPVGRSLGEGRPFEPGVVILDPPREGCAPDVLDDVFGELRPPTAVYVSCDPTSLARDLAAIDRHGYRVESLQPVDMFPHTAHVETVVVLRRGGGGSLHREANTPATGPSRGAAGRSSPSRGR
jgi:23S rRNA (uracil1939-C5)-methyltransferase